MKYLLVFDFDYTIIDDNSDTWIVKCAPEKTLPNGLRKSYQKGNWTEYMGRVFRYLGDEGIREDEMKNTMTTIPFTAGMEELLNFIGKNKDIFDCIIISDSNAIFIDWILKAANFQDVFDAVFTNPAAFNASGYLTVQHFHTHHCTKCPKNLCKGKVLIEFIDKQLEQEVKYAQIIYVGDGGNDLCPVTFLKKNDVAMPRKGFTLQKLISEKTRDLAPVESSVLVWTSAMALKGQEDYTYVFKDPSHPVDFLDAFRTFYHDGLFTDIALQCPSGVTFHCHKAVLAACSNYFKAMFTADMKEKFKDKIKLSGISHAILEGLIDYAYSSQIKITERNVQSLLEAADLLQFISVKRACEEFLVRHLDLDNCIGMHSFAELHMCTELEKESKRILLSRFKEVWQQEEFLEISREKLVFVLTSENLNVWTEEGIIEPVIKWTAHDTEKRIECLPDLLSLIQIDVDAVYLKTASSLQSRCLLTENKLRFLIYSALRLKRKEISRRSTATMYVIGGYYWHPLSEVHIWDPLTNVWIQGAEMPDYARESYGVTSVGPNVYVTGGYRTDNIEALDTVWIYNCETDEWTEGSPMLNARYYHCAVTLSGCVYALGGYRKGAPAKEAEFYDPLKKKWAPIANMIKGVGNATACVLNEVIYVIGGHCGYRGSCTYDKVQTYNSDIDEWSLVTSSPHPEYGLCSIPLENQLYLVGGQTTITEYYDPEQNVWREIAPMMERRMECGAVVMNGCIYVTGGYSYSKGTYLQSIEKYNPELNKWEIVGNLPSPMRSHGCVCVYNV
ncbi:kelch-like protein 23 isoform X1 [Ornithorhynchus anatinus]|uniref:Kelch like family member 23 n=2 Tax=Ornithorhynchus anatinus TaxID=9258 RepID=F6VSM1_ORNAN|nr:kelch-like protein 23 isoform X1 [Ornithorhynchus anatinus]XP_007669392.2 kelch-like protein 23 isoform X1 [Ornithorhynchus anatinus]XP_007669393.2 kelch-like protein 23 isoform X1 [Ornithorhynchus anatinus]XP_028927921.1 kelch-like protein 23 isoform X1 [Ornithorhynchus anatinus]XP_028927922.1 kelch-like protein 23 isoform X1 [Ornithorhynchus anatinus]